jgi:hypothetical protein
VRLNGANLITGILGDSVPHFYLILNRLLGMELESHCLPAVLVLSYDRQAALRIP